jgi:hypothetical protein
MQEIHWTRFRVLHSCQNFPAARRALYKAYECMMEQLKTLKGPMRRRFMAMPINVGIAETAAKVLVGRLDPVPAKAVVAAQNGNRREFIESSRQMPDGEVPLDREVLPNLPQKGLRKSDETPHIPATLAGQ